MFDSLVQGWGLARSGCWLLGLPTCAQPGRSQVIRHPQMILTGGSNDGGGGGDSAGSGSDLDLWAVALLEMEGEEPRSGASWEIELTAG